MLFPSRELNVQKNLSTTNMGYYKYVTDLQKNRINLTVSNMNRHESKLLVTDQNS